VQDQDWFDTFIPDREREFVRDIFRQTLEEQASRGVLNSIMTKSGMHKEIRWSNNVIYDQAGNVSGILAIGLDVTERMEAERKARRSDRLATIGQTMAGMAHESRNALQRIRNSVELLEDELESDSEALRYVEKISRAGNDLQDLLEEVRAYAAPIVLDREKISLASIWRRAWENLEHKRTKAVLVEQSSGNKEPLVLVDTRRMEQVFRNLFENAFDACGEDIEVTIAFEHSPGELLIYIRDNGPGMPAEVKDSIFEAFFTTKPTGTGLGMAIVHRIIEAHAGTIRVTDHSPGTEFEIRLETPSPA
jgi:signal transduction histidine kinase